MKQRKLSKPALATATLVCLLATPVAFAAEGAPSLADLSAAEIASTGSTSLSGELRAFQQENSPLEFSGAWFTLTAGAMLLSIDGAWSNLTVPPVAPTYETGTQNHEYGASTVVGIGGARLLHGFYVLPVPPAAAPTVEVASHGGAMEAAAPGTVNVDRDVPSERVPPVQSVTGSVRWMDALGESTVTVRGDFLLALFDWDFTVESAGGTDTYRTGETQEPIDPTCEIQCTGVSPFAKWATQAAFAYVTGGELSFGWPEPGHSELFLDGVTIAADSVSLDHARLDLSAPGTDPIQVGEMRLTGDLQLENLHGAAGTVAGALAGTVESAFADGKPFGGFAAAITPAGTLGSVWLPWVGLGVLLTSAAGAEYARRKRFGLRMHRMERFLDAGEYRRVLDGINPLLTNPLYARDASVMKTLALLQLQRLDDAERFLDALEPWQGPEAATQEYLRAYLHALKSDGSKAIAHLQKCLAIAPDYEEEIRANPAFHSIFALLEGDATSGPVPAYPSTSHSVEGYA